VFHPFPKYQCHQRPTTSSCINYSTPTFDTIDLKQRISSPKRRHH
jgi:hypothetical protein